MLVKSVSFLTAIVLHKVTPTTKLNQQIHKKDIDKVLKELYRVLKPNGHLLILELSVPQNKILLSLYKLYFLHILPFIGKKISGDNKAYTYLPQSVMNFPKPKDFLQTMEECGFKDVRQKALTFGLCRMYEGKC